MCASSYHPAASAGCATSFAPKAVYAQPTAAPKLGTTGVVGRASGRFQAKWPCDGPSIDEGTADGLGVVAMATPQALAQAVEDRPVLPPGDCERVSGYGVMGLPFASGHVLGLRRWTASSVGERFTSIWHRDPAGRWTFYESAPCEVACSRYFGADVTRFLEGPIDLHWEGPERLRIRTGDGTVDWEVVTGSTAATRAMSAIGSMMPLAAWRSGRVLRAVGAVAGRVLGVGKVQLTGTTSNRQHFDANPLRIWYVKASHAVVDGEDLGPIGPLPQQAHMADFYFPQRGMFAVGRVFISPLESSAKGPQAVTASR